MLVSHSIYRLQTELGEQTGGFYQDYRLCRGNCYVKIYRVCAEAIKQNGESAAFCTKLPAFLVEAGDPAHYERSSETDPFVLV